MLIREQLKMNVDAKKDALPMGGRGVTQEPLWELYEKLESCRVEASQSINPMVKARSAEKAIPLTQEMIRQIIVRLIEIENKGN